MILYEIKNKKIFYEVFFFSIYRTALHVAVEKENLEIVKLLLSNKNIDINQRSILKNTFLYHSKSYFFIQF